MYLEILVRKSFSDRSIVNWIGTVHAMIGSLLSEEKSLVLKITSPTSPMNENGLKPSYCSISTYRYRISNYRK